MWEVNVIFFFVFIVFQSNLVKNSSLYSSVISLKFSKYHLLGFLTLFLFVSSLSFFPLHCPLHDHWYSEK